MAGSAAAELREPATELPPDESGKARREALAAIFDPCWERMTPWRPRWNTIARAILPDRAAWCDGTTSAKDASVPPNYGVMMDNTATLAARDWASGFSTKLSNPSTRWLGLTTTDENLDSDPEITRWLYVTVSKLLAVMDRSNFYAELQDVYLVSGTFSIGAMSIEPDRQSVIRCTSHPIGSFSIGEDGRGRVNEFAREWTANAFQLAKEFGVGPQLPPDVHKALRERDRTAKFRVRHLIYANENADAEAARYDAKRMPFVECYWLPDDNRKAFVPLHEGFYAEWPVPAPRVGPRVNGGVFGAFAPGFIALPDTLMLSEIRLQYLNALRKAVTPPTVSGGAFKNKKIYSVPGANNVDDQTQGDPQLKAMYQVNIPFQHISAEMELVRQHIRSAYFTDRLTPMLLRMAEQAEQPTALQASLAQAESLGIFGPIIEGYSDNLHDIAVDRIFGIMWRAGLIDPPPAKLQGKPLRVVLKSAMAQAQKAVGAAALERRLQFTGAVASMWGPITLDGTNPHEMIRLWDEAAGTPPSVSRLPAERDAISAARLQAQQQAAAVAAAPQVAKAARDLSETKTGTGSALDAMTAGVN